jgi:hypothetical protein
MVLLVRLACFGAERLSSCTLGSQDVTLALASLFLSADVRLDLFCQFTPDPRFEEAKAFIRAGTFGDYDYEPLLDSLEGNEGFGRGDYFLVGVDFPEYLEVSQVRRGVGKHEGTVAAILYSGPISWRFPRSVPRLCSCAGLSTYAGAP